MGTLGMLPRCLRAFAMRLCHRRCVWAVLAHRPRLRKPKPRVSAEADTPRAACGGGACLRLLMCPAVAAAARPCGGTRRISRNDY